jgi:hypothetical protein
VKKRKREKINTRKEAKKNPERGSGCVCGAYGSAPVSGKRIAEEVSALTGRRLVYCRTISSEEFRDIQKEKNLKEIQDGIFVEE